MRSVSRASRRDRRGRRHERGALRLRARSDGARLPTGGSTRSAEDRSPVPSEWWRSFSIHATCRKGSMIRRRCLKPNAIRFGWSFRQGAQRLDRIRQHRGDRCVQHPRRRIARHGALRPGAKPQAESGADRPTRHSRPARMPGACDHWRRRPLDVDRRRLDHRQDDARRADAQFGPRLSAIWLGGSRRLCDGGSPARAGGFLPPPVSSALVSALGGRRRRLRKDGGASKGCKSVATKKLPA
jgi:hypothetical protein